MKILVACEESQEVCKAFRERGHIAYSCDIVECSGGHPEWHIKQDVIPLLNGHCTFETCDGQVHNLIKEWDIIIAFPPCTHLASSGARWFEQKRKDGRQQEGIDFFLTFTKINCDKVVIENPVGIMSTIYRKPDQIIQPWMFGNNFSKSTCLWLKGVKPLKAKIVDKPKLETVEFINKKSGKVATMPKWYADAWKLNPEERAKLRSKTFPGVAKAMAEQWG